MRQPPDLFELRLDALVANLQAVQREISKLPAPLILTARHPREGGANDLPPAKRRALLRKFLNHANYIDIELRSAGSSAAILAAARAKNIRTIISFHDFSGTPSAADLNEIARAAKSSGVDVLKIATRTDTPEQLGTLQQFFSSRRRRMKIAAMGIGKLGRAARLWCAKRGSILNYAHLGIARIDGQLSVAQWRRALK
ncbi:MAG: type I 3-dehydroquinate dehydratase [Verrucomicrobiaceae bacterium]|nr:type I 3-dehydroquinate dehydratase [Verrucomicrobiaceae bacterium]